MHALNLQTSVAPSKKRARHNVVHAVCIPSDLPDISFSVCSIAPTIPKTNTHATTNKHTMIIAVSKPVDPRSFRNIVFPHYCVYGVPIEHRLRYRHNTIIPHNTSPIMNLFGIETHPFAKTCTNEQTHLYTVTCDTTYATNVAGDGVACNAPMEMPTQCVAVSHLRTRSHIKCSTSVELDGLPQSAHVLK